MDLIEFYKNRKKIRKTTLFYDDKYIEYCKNKRANKNLDPFFFAIPKDCYTFKETSRKIGVSLNKIKELEKLMPPYETLNGYKYYNEAQLKNLLISKYKGELNIKDFGFKFKVNNKTKKNKKNKKIKEYEKDNLICRSKMIKILGIDLNTIKVWEENLIPIQDENGNKYYTEEQLNFCKERLLEKDTSSIALMLLKGRNYNMREFAEALGIARRKLYEWSDVLKPKMLNKTHKYYTQEQLDFCKSAMRGEELKKEYISIPKDTLTKKEFREELGITYDMLYKIEDFLEVGKMNDYNYYTKEQLEFCKSKQNMEKIKNIVKNSYKDGKLNMTEASEELGVSSGTLGRWDRLGIFKAKKNNRGEKLYSEKQIRFAKKRMRNGKLRGKYLLFPNDDDLSIPEMAKKLNIYQGSLKEWRKILPPKQTKLGYYYYTQKQLKFVKSRMRNGKLEKRFLEFENKDDLTPKEMAKELDISEDSLFENRKSLMPKKTKNGYYYYSREDLEFCKSKMRNGVFKMFFLKIPKGALSTKELTKFLIKKYNGDQKNIELLLEKYNKKIISDAYYYLKEEILKIESEIKNEKE